jgi:uncharacterized protein YuzE
VLDFDKDGRIVALELLSASRHLAAGALPIAAGGLSLCFR